MAFLTLRCAVFLLITTLLLSGCGSRSEIERALDLLPADDRTAAERQKTCPLSGDPLGSAGKPYKMTLKDQTFFLCCRRCANLISESDADNILAKVSALLEDSEEP